MSENKCERWEWDDTVWNYDKIQQAPWLVVRGTMDKILSGEIECRSEADAHLISAAPELFEALEGMIEMIETGGFGKDYILDVSRAALAKAKGEVGGFVNAESGYQVDPCPDCQKEKP